MLHRRAFMFVRPIVAAALFVISNAAHAEAQSEYRYVEIPGGVSPAFAINDEGRVAGFWSGPGGSLGYVWTLDAGPQPVITDPTWIQRFPFNPTNEARRLGINNAGVVAGMGCPNFCSAQEREPWTADRNGNISFLGQVPGFLSGKVSAINARGDVVGALGPNNLLPGIARAGLAMDVLDGFSSTGLRGVANDINDAGLVVGSSHGLAFIWSEASGPVMLPVINPAFNHVAFGINAFAQVVGAFGDGAGAGGVFRWSPATGTVNLNAPNGAVISADINDRGEIVATINPPTGGFHPYLFKNGVWTNVNVLVPGRVGLPLEYATAINNHGWIVGAGPFGGAGYVVIPPSVRVTANGSDDTVSVGPGDALAIGLSFQPGGFPSLNPAELYIGLAAPFGTFWLHPVFGLSLTPSPLYQGPLPAFGPATIFNFPDVSVLPSGSYLWIVAVDADVNGVLNAHYLDWVLTQRTP